MKKKYKEPTMMVVLLQAGRLMQMVSGGDSSRSTSVNATISGYEAAGDDEGFSQP